MVNDKSPQQTLITWTINIVTRVVSIGSMVGSAITWKLFVYSFGRGFYEGAFRLLCGVFLVQAVGLALTVGLPLLHPVWRRHVRLSRGTTVVFAIALTGVVAEAIGLAVIPVTSH